MSFPTSFGEKITNKSRIQLPQTGDDNANQLSISYGGGRGVVEDTGYSTSSLPPLVSQHESHDELEIWGSEQRCMDSELREFERVECPGRQTEEDENEEEDDGGSVRDGRDEGPMSISSSSTASSVSIGTTRNDNDSNKVESRRKEMQRKMACHSTEALDTCEKDPEPGRGGGREGRTGGLKESKSETNVFVSSLSAVSLSGSLCSALDCSGQTLKCLPSSRSNPYPDATNTTSAQTRRRVSPVDANQNSPPLHPQEEQDPPRHTSQEHGQEQGSHQRNRLSCDGGLGQRRRAGFEERALAPRRQQLVRPLCQTELGRTKSSVEPNVHQPPATDSHRKFTKTSLREPSDFSHLYLSTHGVSKAAQPNQASHREEAPPLQKKPPEAAQFTASPSKTPTSEKRPQTQLTYRRNCSSPNRTGVDSRSSTPPHSPLRTPQGSPRRQPSMYLVSRDAHGVVRHIPQGCNPAALASAQGYGNTCMKAPVKTNISTTGIPKAPLNSQQSFPNSGPRDSSPSPKLKPKGVRPKIITYVRKNPHFKPQAADGPYQVSSLPTRLSTCAHGASASAYKDAAKDLAKTDKDARGAPVLSASNLLYDKYRQDMQANFFPAGLLSRSIRAPGHTNTVPPAHTTAAQHAQTHSHTAPSKLGGKAADFYGAPKEVVRSASLKGSSTEDPLQLRTAAQAGGSGSLLRSGRGLRLGLGAVTRTATGSVKGRGLGQGQKSTASCSQPVHAVSPATNQKSQANAEDEVFTHPVPPPAPSATAAQPPAVAAAPRSLLLKSSQSGLRAPGFVSSRLPASRLAAFGFVRSSSVSSVSSAHSADSTQSDPCRTAHRLSVSEEPPVHRGTSGPTDQQRGAPCRSNSLQPPSTPALPRRFLPAQPRSSPGVGRKEFQRSSEVTRSLPSSPKRLAVVPPKPQSPVQSGQRPAGGSTRGAAPPGSPCRVAPLRLRQEQQESLQREKEEAQQKERERGKEERREEVQRLQGRCEQQERQLRALRDELRKTSLGLEAFIITTQHYCLKIKTAEENEKRMYSEMQKLREEMASNSVRWERLKLEKTSLEVAFERELQELQQQQEAELAAVEEGLRKCHAAEAEHLRAEYRSEMEELRTQQQEQVEEMTVQQQAAVQELRDMHNITMATLHEEHARTMRDLRKAHEQQKMLLEEDSEKLRLSLQDQVDTLTFQNHSLRDKAKRFEEALRRSTDEQIVDALAPYQHIEQDLKSLKEVVEMKNQQIHQQELKISDLEKVAQKNVFLEEKVQVLQQQNEDLKARIEMNLTLSRQLSEENANLHESVEKENTEKKRLSRNNEELLWRLQTSPLMSPCSSPLHRPFSTSPIPSSPLFSSSSSPVARCESPTHCSGCPHQAQYASPSHRANQNYSPGPATPTHRAASNQNYSPGPATPTHRAASNQNYSPGPATPTHRAPANRCNPSACLSSSH